LAFRLWEQLYRGGNVADGSGTEVAGRVADVLLAFTDEPGSLGVSEIARRLDLSKAVVHRILQALTARGLITTDPVTRAYRLGAAAAALGARALRDSDLRDAAMPVIRELQLRTGETTTVSALVGDGRVYLDQVESRQEIKMTVEVGRRFPLHAGSSGQCILAFLPEELQAELIGGGLEALTPHTIVDEGRLPRVLADIRATGHAFSQGERQPGAASVAAPVFGFDGAVVGAISVCGPVPRVDEAAGLAYAPMVREAADEISRALGWSGGLPAVRRMTEVQA
jgi:DNA-binding IclR family transcriptional regulator